MYKLAIKFLVVTLVMTGACMVLSSNDKALAATTSCPSGDSAPADWGNDSDGEGAGVMSSLIMKARDTSGNLLNPHFTLQSQAPGWPDNAQIYHWPIGSGGSVSNTDQWPQHGDFQFGTHLSGDGGISCNGWVALGPGINGNVGNGWVLNCKNPSGNNNYFWISHIDNPTGQTGQWWLLDSNGNVLDQDINSGSSPHLHFPVTNGANMRFTLVWHPSSPPNPPAGTCTLLHASLTGNYFNQSKRTKVEIKRTNLSGGTGGGPEDYIDYIPGPNGQGAGGSYTGTTNRDYNYQPQHNSIEVVVTVQYYTNGTNPHWQDVPNGTTVVRTTADPCFTASCSISYVDGTGPQGIVLAGQQMHIHGTYVNTSPSPDNMIIWNPALSASGSQNGGNNHTYTLFGGPAHKGYPYDFDIYMTAPNNVTRDNFSLTPIYFDNAAIGGPCSDSEPVYQHFDASGGAHSHLLPTQEHADHDNYYTYVNVSGTSYPVNLTTASKLTKNGSILPPPPTTSNSGGQYSGRTYTLGGSSSGDNYSISSLTAGDSYCASVRIYPLSGYVGPDHNVVGGTGDQTWPDCDRVVNEPYFKVFNSGVSAGGDFDQCTTDGGTLAGYADISDPPGATRGSSSQLSALALVKITGFASAQSPGSINGSPTKLSFANTGVQVDSGGSESPVLGGQYGGCRTLTNETRPPSARNIISSSTTAARPTGAYKHSGNLTITGGTLGANRNVSIFVDGDVYISGNITYGNGWQAGSAPSFVVHATGNIYIAPGVKHLAGVYIAQEKSDGSKGKIYTCADTSNHFSPMSDANLYSGCKNQLVVTGSFVAKQTNLMRTFGSLRDEEPSSGTPAVSVTKNGADHSSCGPISPGTYPCYNDGNSTYNYQEYASTYSLAGLPAGSDYHLTINYKNYQGNFPLPSGLSPPYMYDIEIDVNGVKVGNDLSLSTTDSSSTVNLGALPANPSITIKWKNNYYGTDIGFIPWRGNQYAYDPNFEINSLSVDPTITGPTVTGPPFTSCSNKNSASQQTDPKACAGEIFEFSPTLYLSSPAVNPPGGGSLQFQSITSLPPVL